MQVLDSLIDGPLKLRNRRDGDELIGMIVRYLRTGELPEPRTDSQEAVLIAVMPVLETSRARIAAGSAGGKQASKDGSKTASKRASKSTSKTVSKQASKDGCVEPSNDASKRPSEEEEEVGRGIRSKEPVGRARFHAPSTEEVAAYCSESSLVLDAQAFVDFYSSKGWKVGTSPMKDWKAAARNWARRDRQKLGGTTVRGPVNDEYANL